MARVNCRLSWRQPGNTGTQDAEIVSFIIRQVKGKQTDKLGKRQMEN